MTCNDGFLINSAHTFLVDIDPQGATRNYKRLAVGIEEFDPTFNESSEDYTPISFDGLGASIVKTVHPQIVFSGDRYVGDEAQDFIVSRTIGVGIDRETNLIWQFPNGDGYFGKVVMDEIKPTGGSAKEKGTFNVSFKLYGGPVYSGPSVPPINLTVTGTNLTVVALSWTAPSVEGNQLKYNVYRNGVLITTTTNTFFQDTGRVASTSYDYYVTTVTPILVESEPSNQVTATTETTPLLNNFVGKISGSLVANPNVYKRGSAVGLVAPSGFAFEPPTFDYTSISTLNGVTDLQTTNVVNRQSQGLFQWNLIEDTQRAYGTIPGNTTGEKVQWLKDNITQIVHNWHGRGSGTIGNEANIRVWNPNTLAYEMQQTHTSGSVSLLTITLTGAQVDNYIDVNGNIFFNAYAPTSDGVTLSALRTDYVESIISYSQTPL